MKFECRRLTENELELLMNWRMSPDVSRHMLTTPKLTLEGQYNWFHSVKHDASQIRWVIFADNIPIGSLYLVKIDTENKRCESGLFIAEKQYSSLEFLLALKYNLYDFVFLSMGLNRLYGEVLETNKTVMRLDKMFGMKEEGVLHQHVYKDGRFYNIHVFGITKEMWLKKKDTLTYEKYYFEA